MRTLYLLVIFFKYQIALLVRPGAFDAPANDAGKGVRVMVIGGGFGGIIARWNAALIKARIYHMP